MARVGAGGMHCLTGIEIVSLPISPNLECSFNAHYLPSKERLYHIPFLQCWHQWCRSLSFKDPGPFSMLGLFLMTTG